MRDLSRLKTILNMAREFESKRTDNELEKGVKRTTKLLIEKNPSTTFEELMTNLLISARESYKHMINSGEVDSTVDMFMELAKMIAEEENEEIEGNEFTMLRFIIKSEVISNMLQKSFNVSVKAITDTWNGIHGTE